MAPDCNQRWTSGGGGEGWASDVPKPSGWVRELHKGSGVRVCRGGVIV